MVQSIGVRDLSDPTVRAKLTVDGVTQQITKGSANKLMPSFAGLMTSAQITAVAEYVISPAFLTQAAPQPPPVPTPRSSP